MEVGVEVDPLPEGLDGGDDTLDDRPEIPVLLLEAALIFGADLMIIDKQQKSIIALAT